MKIDRYFFASEWFRFALLIVALLAYLTSLVALSFLAPTLLIFEVASWIWMLWVFRDT